MALIQQRIDNLLNGVSEQPEEVRHPSYGTVQDNALDTVARGKLKRPPTDHVAELSGNPGTVAVHTYHRDETEAYRILIGDGKVKVYDARTGAPQAVDITPGSEGYLNSPNALFRAFTIGDTTMIVNRDKVVGKLNDSAPPMKYEALVYVRQADFSTGYILVLDGVTVTHVTPDATSSASRQQVATDVIADALMKELTRNITIGASFNVTIIGSTLHIERKDGKDFSVSAKDGMADKALKVVKGSVQSFDDLPYRAKDGFVVKVTGHQGTDKDDFWVIYDAADTPVEGGVWRETLKPGTLTSMDPKTLPHKLVRDGWTTRTYRTTGGSPIPTVSDGTYVNENAGWTRAGDGTIVQEDADDLLRDLGEARERPLDFTTGGPRVVYANFDMDTSVMEPGTQAEVRLLRTRGSASTVLASRSYRAGNMHPAESLMANDDVLPTDKLRLELDYGARVTPPPSRRSLLVGWRPGHPTFPGLRLRRLRSRRVHFGSPTGASQFGYGSYRMISLLLANRYAAFEAGTRPFIYPAGVQVLVELDGGTTGVHTPETDITAEQMAEAIRLSILNEGGGYTVTRVGSSLEISSQNDTAPEVFVATSYSDETIAWVPGAELVPGALVGGTLHNLTDGSNGIITANTATTVTVQSLGGGKTNRFHRGDEVRAKVMLGHFTFGPCEWSVRHVGDLDSAPWPSFVGQRITDVFAYQNRLGFIHGESIVLSRSGDLYNFFRETVQDVLPGDYIDVENGHALTGDFHSVGLWSNGLYVHSEAGQYILSGEPAMTPQTVRLDLASNFPNTSKVRPCYSGSRMFLARFQGGRTRIFDYTHPPQERPHADDLTSLVPGYLRGYPVAVVGDGALGFLAVACSEERNVMYVFLHEYGNDGSRAQASWSRWVLPTGSTIVHLDMIDGNLGLVIRRGSSLFLESMDLTEALTYEG